MPAILNVSLHPFSNLFKRYIDKTAKEQIYNKNEGLCKRLSSKVLDFGLRTEREKLGRTKHFQKSVGLFISAIYGMIMLRSKPPRVQGQLTISGKIMAPE
jgi:hypothetical protein